MPLPPPTKARADRRTNVPVPVVSPAPRPYGSVMDLVAKSVPPGGLATHVVPQTLPQTVEEAAAPVHLTEVTDEGQFSVARCSCGWRSYARRSRPRARSEAKDHLILHGLS